MIRGLWWRLNGTQRYINASLKSENYRRSAHVTRILYRYSPDGFTRSPDSVFLTVHDGFVDPETVLADDCTLYSITSDEAIFVQVKNKAAVDEVLASDFLWMGQYYKADKLISLPLCHFHKLAEEMPDNGAGYIFLYNQARCGGTLVTAMFKQTGRCICFNEPTCLSTVSKRIFTDRIWPDATARRVLRNTIRVLCKPHNTICPNPLAYVIKPSVLDTVTMEMTHELFPDVTSFFIYRDPIEVAISIRKIGEVVMPLKYFMNLPNFAGFVALVLDFHGLQNAEYTHWTAAIHPGFEFGYRATCFTVKYYLQALKRGINIHGLYYRDVVDKREELIREMFNICRFERTLVERARQALDKDSQANSPFSRDKMRLAFPVLPNPPAGFLDIARTMSEEFGVPAPDAYRDKTFRLPNSVLT